MNKAFYRSPKQSTLQGAWNTVPKEHNTQTSLHPRREQTPTTQTNANPRKHLTIRLHTWTQKQQQTKKRQNSTTPNSKKKKKKKKQSTLDYILQIPSKDKKPRFLEVLEMSFSHDPSLGFPPNTSHDCFLGA
jgi:hypothetical protein